MKRRTLLVPLGLVLLGFGVHAQIAQPPPNQGNQPPPSNDGLIAGIVRDAASGAPLAQAVVALAVGGQNSAQASRVVTDADGRFFFDRLAAGTMTVSATKPGWAPGGFGQRRPADPPVPLTLRANERRGVITIDLWRYGIAAGRVTDEEESLIGAEVRIFQQTFPAGTVVWKFVSRALTDDRGGYRFSALLPGNYIIVVPATVTTEPTALRAQTEGPPTYLQTMTAIGAAPMSFSRADTVTSNDRLLVSSPLGVVSAGVTSASATLAYETTFFPSTKSAGSAAIVRVESGRERSAVDIDVRRAIASDVSGTITNADGSPAGFHAVHLVPADSADAPVVDAATTVTDAAGAFTFVGVPAGQYVARVVRIPAIPPSLGRLGTCGGTGTISFVCMSLAGSPPAIGVPVLADPLQFAEARVSVGDRPVRGVALNLRPGATINGHVEFEGVAPRPAAEQLARVTVSVEPANGRTNEPAGGFDFFNGGRLTSNGQFITSSVLPGRYFIRVGNPPAGWAFKNASYQGRDVSESAVDLSGDVRDVVITFTDRAGGISGSVRGDSAGANADAVVIIFPGQQSEWTGYGRSSRRVRSVAVREGRYTLPSPPDGTYFLVAVPNAEAGDWQNPQVLARLAAIADPVQISSSEPQTINLQLRRLR